MLFCENGTAWDDVWADEGINRCCFQSTSAIVLFVVVFCLGMVQCSMYSRYAIRKRVPKPLGRVIQITATTVLLLEALGHMICYDVYLGEKTLYGYQILEACLIITACVVSLWLMALEKSSMLSSIPTRGQGIVLLVYWALFFIKENLNFVSWNDPSYWWHVTSPSDLVELALFITRYISLLVLLLSGVAMKNNPYIILDEENGHNIPKEASTWKNVFAKLKTMMPYVWPKGSLLLQIMVVICLIILVIGRVINVFVPIYSKYIVNSLTYKDTGALEYRWDYIVIFCALAFLKGVGADATGFLNNLRGILWIKVQQFTTRSIQLKLFSHLHSLSLRWHLGRKTGEVLRVVDRGTNSINNVLNYLFFQILPTLVDIIIAIVYFITFFNYLFGLIVFGSMACYLAITFSITEWRAKYRREMNLKDNAANTKAVDSLLNFETVKYYEASTYEEKHYKAAILDYQESDRGRLRVVWNLPGPALSPVMLAGLIQQSFIDMENMFDLLQEDTEVKDIPDAKDIIITGGQVEFKNVSFYYEPSKAILKDISFCVPPGQIFALVGHTGCGKSTIVRLLFRFYDIQSGTIKIDGQDISLISQASLRKQIGVVPQDTVLFNNDIMYNIRYGNVHRNTSEEEVRLAARAAEIHDRILTFPNQYDTVVGERGLKLSGGEKQRVAIARTLLKDPAIVLLDEATSALDTKTERSIQSSLSRVCENRTTIIVAHRLSTIVNAHQIIVLNEGVILEVGTHKDLLRNGGHYSEMWNQQLISQKEAEERDRENGGDDVSPNGQTNG